MGADCKSTWHNENRGVLLIDNYFKKVENTNAEEEKDIDDFEDSDSDFSYEDEDELE